MSVICWDGHTLAADKRAILGTLIRTTSKIFRVRDGVAGYAGDAAFGQEMLAWYEAGAIPSDFPASQRGQDDWAGLLVIKTDGIYRYERTPHPVRFHDKTFAIGSGRDFALAAMYLGRNAEEAVAVAIAFDSGCGNGIDALAL